MVNCSLQWQIIGALMAYELCSNILVSWGKWLVPTHHPIVASINRETGISGWYTIYWQSQMNVLVYFSGVSFGIIVRDPCHHLLVAAPPRSRLEGLRIRRCCESFGELEGVEVSGAKFDRWDGFSIQDGRIVYLNMRSTRHNMTFLVASRLLAPAAWSFAFRPALTQSRLTLGVESGFEDSPLVVPHPNNETNWLVDYDLGLDYLIMWCLLSCSYEATCAQVEENQAATTVVPVWREVVARHLKQINFPEAEAFAEKCTQRLNCCCYYCCLS